MIKSKITKIELHNVQNRSVLMRSSSMIRRDGTFDRDTSKILDGIVIVHAQTNSIYNYL